MWWFDWIDSFTAIYWPLNTRHFCVVISTWRPLLLHAVNWNGQFWVPIELDTLLMISTHLHLAQITWEYYFSRNFNKKYFCLNEVKNELSANHRAATSTALTLWPITDILTSQLTFDQSHSSYTTTTVVIFRSTSHVLCQISTGNIIWSLVWHRNKIYTPY